MRGVCARAIVRRAGETFFIARACRFSGRFVVDSRFFLPLGKVWGLLALENRVIVGLRVVGRIGNFGELFNEKFNVKFRLNLLKFFQSLSFEL